MRLKNKKLISIAIHILVWVAFAILPLLFKPADVTFSTQQLMGIYTNFGVTLLLFYIIYLLIIPKFFFKKKIGSALTLMVLASAFSGLILPQIQNPRLKQPLHSPKLSPQRNLERGTPTQRPPGRGVPPPKKFDLAPNRNPFFEHFLFYLLVSGTALSIRATQKWIQEENDKKSLETEKSKLELAWLKNQVSPHFFFNTLNNIHSLIESRPHDAQKSIQLLSKLMRYLLYESNEPVISLQKEISFVESYIGLMKLKLSKSVEVLFTYPTQVSNIDLPPMLFNPLIENAFKYGISYEQASYVHINIASNGKHLNFSIKNSVVKSSPQKEHSGIGLKNLKKRLHLLFKSAYSLKITSTASDFSVVLSIPLYD